MYSSRISSVLKGFIYVVVVLLALCSIAATLCLVFADEITFMPATDVAGKLLSVATVLLVVHAITMVMVVIFQIAKLTDYLPYLFLSLVAIIAYLTMCYFAIQAGIDFIDYIKTVFYI